LTLHDEAVEWVSVAVGGRNQHEASREKRVRFKGKIPDVVVGDKELKEIHEIETLQISEEKLESYRGEEGKPRRILWIAIPNPERAFQEIRVISKLDEGFKPFKEIQVETDSLENSKLRIVDEIAFIQEELGKLQERKRLLSFEVERLGERFREAKKTIREAEKLRKEVENLKVKQSQIRAKLRRVSLYELVMRAMKFTGKIGGLIMMEVKGRDIDVAYRLLEDEIGWMESKDGFFPDGNPEKTKVLCFTPYNANLLSKIKARLPKAKVRLLKFQVVRG